jgi:biopolymer transport protein ExbB
MNSKLLSAFAALVLLALPQAAKAWWNDDWSDRKKLTVDAGQTGAALSENLSGAVVLVRLSDGNFKFADAKPDGSDLRFVDGDDKTPLKFQIEKFDPLFGIGLVWVQVPKISAGAAQDVWLYWGNNKAPSSTDARGVFDANTTLIYHFNEKAGAPIDAASYGNNAAAWSAAADPSSVIGGGAKFDGSGSLTISGSPSLAVKAGDAQTISFWLRQDQAQGRAILLNRVNDTRSLTIALEGGVPTVEIGTGAALLKTSGSKALPVGAWHHLVATFGARSILYADGEPVASLDGALPELTGTILIGSSGAQDGTGFTGGLDELRFANVERSATWARAEFASQGSDAKLVAYGNDEQTSSWSSGYLATILHSVTLDGWVVISFLVVMAIISWIVMVAKFRYMSRTTTANQRFLVAFDVYRRRADWIGPDMDDPLKALTFQLSDKRAFDDSPLFRIFVAGVNELRLRFPSAGSAAVRHILSQHNMTAIRAALDSLQTKEVQRLNRLMVLLTIAISGGPFLGLLGTVVGVMITFAAIAQSGDVNVNAIAPGIAAALVATVAGLAVAIPALFGYNYLTVRAKEITSDIEDFVNTYIAQVAEQMER